MKNTFKRRVLQFFENIKLIKKDKEARKQFLVDIQQEIADPKSQFNYYHLAINENYDAISTIISIPENFQIAGSDPMKYQKLQELARPINAYIASTLNYGDYFESPNFYYIDEIDDEEKPENEILEQVSCSYVAEWKYAPILAKYPKFKWELTAFFGINSLILGGLIALLIVLL